MLSTNIIHQKFDVQLKKGKNVSFFPSMNGKINFCPNNILKYDENIKHIANMYVIVVKGYI
jgi:peroxiredoxin